MGALEIFQYIGIAVTVWFYLFMLHAFLASFSSGDFKWWERFLRIIASVFWPITFIFMMFTEDLIIYFKRGKNEYK